MSFGVDVSAHAPQMQSSLQPEYNHPALGDPMTILLNQMNLYDLRSAELQEKVDNLDLQNAELKEKVAILKSQLEKTVALMEFQNALSKGAVVLVKQVLSQ
ncbi:hypothetical protein BDV97DRAFT_349590 [Delphinella strobiligena]|nr:hypothetical protein BDV97DRAFT_349590 [Delphinella strobiligena]